MSVLTLEKRPVRSLASVAPVLRQTLRLKVPAWFAAAVVLVVAVSAFLAGRHKPAHHYVSCFGYPMVLDTATGKACYAAPPKPSDSIVQDASYSADGADTPAPTGPAIPMCGKE